MDRVTEKGKGKRGELLVRLLCNEAFMDRIMNDFFYPNSEPWLDILTVMNLGNKDKMVDQFIRLLNCPIFGDRIIHDPNVYDLFKQTGPLFSLLVDRYRPDTDKIVDKFITLLNSKNFITAFDSNPNLVKFGETWFTYINNNEEFMKFMTSEAVSYVSDPKFATITEEWKNLIVTNQNAAKKYYHVSRIFRVNGVMKRFIENEKFNLALQNYYINHYKHDFNGFINYLNNASKMELDNLV